MSVFANCGLNNAVCLSKCIFYNIYNFIFHNDDNNYRLITVISNFGCIFVTDCLKYNYFSLKFTRLFLYFVCFISGLFNIILSQSVIYIYKVITYFVIYILYVQQQND